VTGGERAEVVEAFAAAAEPVLVADGRAEAVVDGRIRATLEVAPPDQRGVALVRATGSRRHLRQLAERAAARGVALEGETEEEVYAALGLPLIPPDEREGTGEVD
jgi:DNA polymerase (family 10)